MEEMISLRDIHFAYSGQGQEGPVFKGLQFSLQANSRVALVGHNGCGKTTLLKIIMGLLAPTAGQIKLFGRPCACEADFYNARRLMGFMFQDAEDQLFCPTVEDDIAFGPLNLGFGAKEVKARVAEVLEEIGLPGYASRVTYALSGGEKKLVALGTVLAMRPRLLLLDEPTSGLDQNAKARVVALLQTLNLPCLVVSHDNSFLNQVTTSVVNLEACK